MGYGIFTTKPHEALVILSREAAKNLNSDEQDLSVVEKHPLTSSR